MANVRFTSDFDHQPLWNFTYEFKAGRVIDETYPGAAEALAAGAAVYDQPATDEPFSAPEPLIEEPTPHQPDTGAEPDGVE